MLRSVFAVGHGRLAVAFEGGHVLEVGESRCYNNAAESSKRLLSVRRRMICGGPDDVPVPKMFV